MWDATFYERCETLTIPSYDGGPAFLFELPLGELPLGLFERLFALRTKHKLPVLAHPERYEPLYSAPELLDRLRDSCALVVDLGAVAGYHGRKRAKYARLWVERGIAHAAASDAHTPDDVRVAAEGIAWIRKRLGDAAVTRLLDTGPRAILAGEHPDG
jgi:protein-tyrosine phosphatase